MPIATQKHNVMNKFRNNYKNQKFFFWLYLGSQPERTPIFKILSLPDIAPSNIKSAAPETAWKTFEKILVSSGKSQKKISTKFFVVFPGKSIEAFFWYTECYLTPLRTSIDVEISIEAKELLAGSTFNRKLNYRAIVWLPTCKPTYDYVPVTGRHQMPAHTCRLWISTSLLLLYYTLYSSITLHASFS